MFNHVDRIIMTNSYFVHSVVCSGPRAKRAVGCIICLLFSSSSMAKVFHTWIWGSSVILPCRSSPVPSGWMVNVGGQTFSGLSRDAQLGLGQGSGWASQEWSQSCSEALLCYFSCVLRVIVLLEGEPSAQSEVQSTLEEVFFQDISVLGRIHLSFNCKQSSCPCS